MKATALLGILALGLMTAQQAAAVSPAPGEMGEARRWAAAKFEGVSDSKQLNAGQRAFSAEPFFSFTYGGKSSVEFLGTWELKRAVRRLDAQRTEHILTYCDRKTGLVIRCIGIEYRDFPTVEWTLYFKNTGARDTPILSDIQALDIRLERTAGPSTEQTEFRLHHHVGSPCAANDYQPLETVLAPGATKRIAAAGGRATNSDLSYFNLQLAANKGMIVVVGWPGQWAAQFTRDKENHLQIRAGQELTHFKLLPGEEVRSPLMVLQFWKGDRIHAQNVWRRWMMAYNVPKPGGKPIAPLLGAYDGYYFPNLITSAAGEKEYLDRYLQEDLKPDWWWNDAGWYINNGDWPNVGTWAVDKKRYPNGLRGSNDYAHAKGMQTIVWFEPERVTPGTWLAKNHPEWVLGGANGGLLNLGNPEAWNWLTNHIDKFLTEQGIDHYRQDFNMDPLSYWRKNDTEDRQGITEIKHVTGYLAYWDELRRRHPELLIDTCASGGRRNDLETLRRSVPLWRSDYAWEPIGQQCQTYGLSFWVPYYGTGVTSDDPYTVRSDMAPFFLMSWEMRKKNLNYPLLRRLVHQWREIAVHYLGDYYPLTPYSLENTVWIAWQFDDPEKGEGMVQAFRRQKSPGESIRVKLHDLDANAVYTVTNFDATGTTEMTGRELADKGLAVTIKDQPGAAIITYKKKP